jgi:hypothetical protein
LRAGVLRTMARMESGIDVPGRDQAELAARSQADALVERRLAASIDAAPADLFEQPLAEQARVLLQRLAAGEVP